MTEGALNHNATNEREEASKFCRADDVSNPLQIEADNPRLQLQAETERQQLADVLRFAPSFMAVLRGPQHIFEWVNDRYAELVGQRTVIGLTVRAALPEVEGQGYFELLDQVYQTGKPHVGVDARVMLRTSSTSAERILQFVYQPMVDAAGAVSGIIVQGIDMTEQRQAEAEVARVTAASAQLQRMYETALSNTPDFVYLFDTAGRFIFVNKALLELWGKDLSQAVGRNFFDLDYPPELAAKLQQQIQEVIETGRPLRDETPYTSAQGTESYEYIFVPVFRADGRVEAVAGTTREISNRKRAEEGLRKSEQRYRALVTATSDVAYRMSADWVWMQPLDGRDLVASSSEPRNDWMSRNIPEFEYDRVTAAIRAAIAQKKTFELEHQVYGADRSLRWTFSRAVPILDEAGNILEWFGTASDVTRRKHAEENLAEVTEESERRKRLYETILSNTPDLAYVFSLDHKFTYVNEGLLTMWGRTWDDAVGKTCLELGYEPWHAEMHNREIDMVKATGQPLRGEVPFDGTFGRRIYDYIFVPVFGKNGEVEAVAGTTRDVTERKEAEEALRDADRKKDDFIALLAHELRNPLAPIRTGLQVIRLAGTSGVVAEAREIMERQLGHMVRLIDDLLDVSRISRNKMELRCACVSIVDVINNAVETSRPQIDEANHVFTISLPAFPIYLNADLTRLSQVFSNLLTNSAKYTPPGGAIWLTVESSNDSVVVSVRDTGCGIPAESLPTIFNMFSQVNRSIERSAGGLGIGLALVKGLVEMHGGTVAAVSEGQGRGTTFTVTLPMLIDQTNSVATSTSNDIPNDGIGKRRILVVDDNRDAADSLSKMLSLMGSEVTTAYDGLEAVEQSERFRPDVILIDVGMPRLNGLEAAERIRTRPWAKNVKIIALTGWGQEADRERSHQAGCDDHLTKPVDLGELMKLISNLEIN